MLIHPNDHLVFFGDSITDCGHERDAPPGDERGWGNGYVRFIAGLLNARRPEARLQISNKGISGNRVYDLEERLETDVLSLRPDLVTILIGINDTWRRFDANLISDADDFADAYRRILERLTGAGCEVILMEPFLLPTISNVQEWRDDLNPKIERIRALAVEFGVRLVPLDGIFQNAAQKRAPSFWAPDGVHPSVAGHALIAEEWFKAASS